MRIKNLKIDSFGKLNSVSIGLDDRITVITGKNETGKSSIASFIKYMLYGFDSSKKQSVFDNQKKKYMPWEGEECAGEICFETQDGKTYRAVRRTAGKSQNMVFDENDMPQGSDNAGEMFLGVSENAYKKTAFVGQKETAFSDEGELDSAIKNMVYSADESVDSRKALKKLEDARKYYLGKSARSGEIFELDKELSLLVSEREKWKDGHKELLSAEYQLGEIQKKIAFNKEKKDSLEKEKENLEYLEAKNKLLQLENVKQQLEKGKKLFEEHYKTMQNGAFVPDEAFVSEIKQCAFDISQCEKNITESTAEIHKAKENLDAVYADEIQKHIFDTLTEENDTSEQLQNRITLLKKNKKKFLIIGVVLTLLVITIPVAVAFYIKSSKISKQLCSIAKKYKCDDIEMLEKKLSFGSSYKNVEETARRHYSEETARLEEQKTVLEKLASNMSRLSEKGGFDASKALEYVEKAQAWIYQNEELKNRCREDLVAYNTLFSSMDVEALSESASKFDSSIEIRDIKTVMQQLAFYTQANDALMIKERELEKNAAVLANTLPKPSEIQSRILSLTRQKQEMQEKHNALSLAIDTLEKASENMRSEAAPKIAGETSTLFSKITDGKYKALYADNQMNLTFLEKNQAQVRDAGYLSTGTLDAAYISLRIALCEFLYKEHPTLVFDDAFANMDNERLCNMLDFLVELSDDFQIVILSCHDREKEYLNGKAKIIDFAV